MKLTTKTLFAAIGFAIATSGLVASHADAALITGKINFTGSATLDSQNLGTATRVNSWADTSTTFGNTGSFTTVAANTPVTFFAPWNFNSGPITNFWALNRFAGDFKFDLISSAIVSQSSSFVFVTGSGVLSGNGFMPTPGRWAFSVQDSTGGGGGTFTFSFSADTSAVAPEGGSALAFLGIALVAVEALRRKLQAV